MAKRIGVVLSGCGAKDGTDVEEALAVLLALQRNGGEPICCAPDVAQTVVIDHVSGDVSSSKAPRNVRRESARLTREPVRDMATVSARDVDGLVIPGGGGATLNLCNYTDKGVVCDVNPDLARLLREMLAAKKPIGLCGGAAIPAARVLGPVAGVRLSAGSKASSAAKHAAVMGAEVRYCEAEDVVIDSKHRVVSTPSHLDAEAPLRRIAIGIDKLVRTVLSFARESRPAAPVQAERTKDAAGAPRVAASPSIPTPAAPAPPAPPAGGPIIRRAPGSS